MASKIPLFYYQILVFSEFLVQFISFHAIVNNFTMLSVIKVYRGGVYDLISKLLPCYKSLKQKASTSVAATEASDINTVNITKPYKRS